MRVLMIITCVLMACLPAVFAAPIDFQKRVASLDAAHAQAGVSSGWSRRDWQRRSENGAAHQHGGHKQKEPETRTTFRVMRLSATKQNVAAVEVAAKKTGTVQRVRVKNMARTPVIAVTMASTEEAQEIMRHGLMLALDPEEPDKLTKHGVTWAESKRAAGPSS